jgi:hypothetical protein
MLFHFPHVLRNKGNHLKNKNKRTFPLLDFFSPSEGSPYVEIEPHMRAHVRLTVRAHLSPH